MSSVNTISGSIKWSGIATGTDFAAMVQQLVNIEKRTITRQQTWQSEWQLKLEKINMLDTRLGTLKMNAQDYDTRDELLARAAASSKPEVATITNTSTAATGIYDVTVGENIVEKIASRKYSDKTAIGSSLSVKDGKPVDADGKIIGAKTPSDKGVLKAVAAALGSAVVAPDDLDYFDNGDGTGFYYDKTATPTPTPADSLANFDGTAIVKYSPIFDFNNPDPEDPTVKQFVAAALWIDKVDDVKYFDNGDGTGYYYDANDSASTPLAEFDGTSITNLKPKIVTLNTGVDPAGTVGMSSVAAAFGMPETDLVYVDTSGAVSPALSTAGYYYDVADTTFSNPLAEFDGTTNTITKTNSEKIANDLTNPTDAVVKRAVANAVGITYVDNLEYDSATQTYYRKGGPAGVTLASVNGGVVTGGSLIALTNDKGELASVSNWAPGDVIPTDTVLHKDLTITMGGKTLTLKYDEDGDLLDASGKIDMGLYDPSAPLYHADMTMDQLAQAINAAVAQDKKDNPNPEDRKLPDISAKLDPPIPAGGTTGAGRRLVITGGEGGAKNHITVSDPTDLWMDKNSVEAPGTGNWNSTSKVTVVDPMAYTGHANKTITVVATRATGGTATESTGFLGSDDITFSWADTEGKSGSFVIKASDWDATNQCLDKTKYPDGILLEQGVRINFTDTTGQNLVQKNAAFTIDCRTPVAQKAADIGLAQSDKWVHEGVGSPTDQIASGGATFDFSYGGQECHITLTGGGVSLSSLAEQINRSSQNPGVVASILNDGMGTANSYKLVLTGRQAGLENSIVILDSKDSALKGTWEHAREAANSMCRVDGYPQEPDWIQRQSNEVGDVLDGVVLTLQGAGTTQITVQNNVTEMVNRIKQLVDSVNFCKKYIKDETKWGGGKLVSKVLEDGSYTRVTEGGGGTVPGIDGEVKTSGVMIGNYGFQISQSRIDSLVTSVIFTREDFIRAMDNNYDGNHPGDFDKLPVTEDVVDAAGKVITPSQTTLYNKYLKQNGLEYTRLSDIGIASDPSNQGLYIVENSKLTEVLTKNPEAVIKLFTFTPSDEPPFQNDADVPAKLQGRVPAPYKAYEDENARPFIRGFAQGMAWTMSDLTRTGDDIDPKTGAVIKPGKGIMRVLSENYSNIISGIDEKIARETKRISMVEARLTEKFSRLETLLSQLQNQQTKNAAALAQLDNKSSSS